MAKDRISFDKRDAQIIASAVKGKAPKAEDTDRITAKIKGYLDIQNGKAPGKLEKQAAAKKAPKAPKAKAPAKKAAPKAKSAPAKKPAKKQAAPKASSVPANVKDKAKAPKAEAKVTLSEFPKAFDAD